jgi:hypothetical protein
MDKVSFGAAGLPGFEAGPKTAPAVVVLQEWWGVTDIIKDQALMISKVGPCCMGVAGTRPLLLSRGEGGCSSDRPKHAPASRSCRPFDSSLHLPVIVIAPPQEGFRVLVPDLYKGKIGADAEEASHVSRRTAWVDDWRL